MHTNGKENDGVDLKDRLKKVKKDKTWMFRRTVFHTIKPYRKVVEDLTVWLIISLITPIKRIKDYPVEKKQRSIVDLHNFCW